MRVVVALDSLKGSLASAAAGRAVAHGVLDADPSASVHVVAIADGGEGTLEAVGDRGRWLEVDTVDALGRALRAPYVVLGADLAVVESARTIGLEGLDRCDASVPPRASSTGVGQQLARALQDVEGQVLVGLGGTASTDGGIGMLQALGTVVHPSHGPGNPLWNFDRLDSGTLPDLSRVIALTDVTNALLGTAGAARTFAAQKGATPEQVDHLEDRMQRWAEALAAAGRPVADRPGSGAAGGLGAALLACGASLAPGFDEVAGLIGLAGQMVGADLVITGEGSLDRQTALGKAPYGTALLARQAGAVVVGLGGRVDRPAAGPFDAVFPIHAQPRTLVDAVAPELTAAELRATAAEVVRLMTAARS